jgi:protein AroM
MKSRVGLITIGQSPRTDIVPHIEEILGPDIQIREIGALDEIEDPLHSEYRYSGGLGPVFATRLRDGSHIELSEATLLPLIRKCVEQLQSEGICVFGLLCTGEYPDLDDIRGLVRPYGLLHGVVDSLMPEGRLGIMVPTPHQVSDKEVEWEKPNREAFVYAASPYRGDEEVYDACARLKAANVGLVVMDCLGYSKRIKLMVCAEMGVPVILAGSLLAWALKEMS